MVIIPHAVLLLNISVVTLQLFSVVNNQQWSEIIMYCVHAFVITQ